MLASPPEPKADQHRLVTVVFCDVVASSELTKKLGPLTTRHYLDRFKGLAREVLHEGHGGSVGSRRGDGIMTVFGIPAMNDDDALRAVRAAAELRKKVAELSAEVEEQFELPFKVRVGVNSGTALVGHGEALEEKVTGETANFAKRLEEAAEPGGILLGVETYRLVRDAVTVKEAAVEVEGAADPVPAYQVVEVLPGRPGRIRRVDGPMIGRKLELRLLHDLFERAMAETSCHLAIALGPAGVGKSRLVEEFVQQLGQRATVLRGHCLSYGDSVTFWPIVEIVHQAAGIQPTDPPEQVRRRLAELVADDEQGELITMRVAQLLGSDADLELPGDTAWAVRRVLEALARRQPLVVLFEDLQWAESTLLEVIEHVAECANDTPIMLVGMARPEELLRRNPHFPSGRLNAASMVLSPLSDSEAETLVTNLLDGEALDANAQAQITRRTEGNPLIIEEFMDALMERGVLRQLDGHWILTQNLEEVSLPLSIQALLAVRLDRLDEEERQVLERAAVVGEQFHLGDITVLIPGSTRAEIATRLDRLVRQELIRQDHDAAVPLPAESGDGYRFRHILIRNAAYDRMSEEDRADLHERYADRLEQTSSERAGMFDELIAYHLNKAVDYLAALPAQRDRQRELARRAGRRFAAAGRRAAIRGDIRPTTSWLERATQLLGDDPYRLELLPDLAEALQASGRLEQAVKVYEEMISVESAAKVYEELVSPERAADAECRLKHAVLGKLYATAYYDLGSFLKTGPDEVQRAIPVFKRRGDELGLAKAHYLLAYADWAMGNSETAQPAVEEARRHAREAGDARWEAHVLRLYCLILYWGKTPLDEVVGHAEEVREFATAAGMRGLQAAALTILARAAAMRDEIPKARQYSRDATAITHNLGELLTQATDSISDGLIELLDGNLPAAEQVLHSGYQALKNMRGTGPGANVAAMLARVYLAARRYADADRMAMECKSAAAADQLDAQIKWRSIRAIVLARRSEFAEAEPLAREALRRAVQTDQLESRAEAHADLAEVLRLAARREEAAQELEQALALYEQKGSRLMAKRVRAQVLALRQ